MQTIHSNAKCPEQQPLEDSNSLSKALHSPFAPFWAKGLKLEGEDNFSSLCACYCPRQNMLIVCPDDQTMRFYDTTTILPHKERNTRYFTGGFTQISFDPENEKCLIGSRGGKIYMYNPSSDKLEILEKREREILAAIFLNHSYYAYSYIGARSLFLGTLDNRNSTRSLNSQNATIQSLVSFERNNFLLAGLWNGYMLLYRRDKLPNLQIYCSVRAHLPERIVIQTPRINVNGKEYVLTASEDRNVKIWHLAKGRMRLLRVKRVKESPHSVVYLEDYKMIAIALSESVDFFRFPSMKFATSVALKRFDFHTLLLMKEKNMIGVINDSKGEVHFDQEIEFIQLSKLA